MGAWGAVRRATALMVVLGLLALLALLTLASTAEATTFFVGPSLPLRDLGAAARLVRPGDRVEVEGDARYPGDVVFRESGTALAKITIVGRRVHGRRPVLAGGSTTLEFRGSHYVLQGFEITGGSARCLYHHGDDLTVRDALIHDCPRHGILGADGDSGSLTLAYVEVLRSGHGDASHQIYVATDEEAHPGSVFRMEHCFIHEGLGGNNLKSRAERNELYANWIEGALYHEVELIGPDGDDRKRRREDSDVVGNVIKKTRPGFAIRIGGDGSGETFGRYRFVNNTIVLGREARAAFRLMNGLESLEAHNNALAREGGGPLRVVTEDDVRWSKGHEVMAGSNNWVPLGSVGVPPGWRNTLFGEDPGFVSSSDLRPAAGSPLIGTGEKTPAAPPDFELPSPLAAPIDLPPQGQLEALGFATPRLRGCADIGAFPPAGFGGSLHPPSAARGNGCGCRGPTGSISSIFGVALLAGACLLRPRAPRRQA